MPAAPPTAAGWPGPGRRRCDRRRSRPASTPRSSPRTCTSAAPAAGRRRRRPPRRPSGGRARTPEAARPGRHPGSPAPAAAAAREQPAATANLRVTAAPRPVPARSSRPPRARARPSGALPPHGYDVPPMEQADVRPLDVATPVFEGPLELLLALAEREELDILQVPLARLTDAYLTALAELPEPDPREMADFLWMAARLLLLKSIRLLPGEQPPDAEQDLLGWEEDVRRRLAEYQAYREMARSLMERAASEPFAFPPPARAVEVEGQEEPLDVTLL